MKKIKSFLALPDIQFPFQEQRAIKALEQFMPIFKPDYLIYTGDQMDLKMIRDYWTGDIGEIKENSIIADYQGFDKMMRRHIQLCGKPKVIFMEGNHEERVKRLLKQLPINKGSDIELEKFFKFKERGITFIPYGSHFKLGKLYFRHNTYINDNHAKKAVTSFKRSILYGDTHTFQAYSDVTPFDVNDVHIAKSIGCLCTRNPDWKHGAPNMWVHGFSWGYVDESNGYFNDYWTKISSGKFLWNGKWFGKHLTK